MELHLTDREHELLVELLQDHHKHLLHDIAKADHHEFRAPLRHRCEMLERIMYKLSEAYSTA